MPGGDVLAVLSSTLVGGYGESDREAIVADLVTKDPQMGLSMKGSGEPKRLGERTNEVEKVGPSEEALPRRAILCYGTGHMLNDLTAACWFTYLLIFLTDVGLSPR